MGSSSQFYRDTVSTEGWENTTVVSDNGAHWWRELVRPPDWSSLVAEVRWWWEVHVYGLACLFSVLAVLCFFTVLRLRSQLSSRPHLHTLNLFLCIMATSRLVVLFVDPYGARKTLPVVLLQLLWDLGYPCLTSSFALLQLSFARSGQVKVSPSRLGNETLISVIITFHFCLVITAGVLGALQRSLRIVWLLTQLLFVCWGCLLCLSSLHGCFRLLRSAVRLPLRGMSHQVEPGCQVSSVSMFADGQQRPSVTQQPRIRITDVDDRTFSFVSESAQAANATSGSESCPLRSPTVLSPVHCKGFESKNKLASPCDDPAIIRPLVADRLSSNSVTKSVLSSIQSAPDLQATQHDLKTSLSRASSRPTLAEFHFDARQLKRQRAQRLLRRLVAAALLGLVLSLLRLHEVLGPRGPGQADALLPWFCLQTLARIVEFSLAAIMVNISQQSLNSHYYHYPT